MGNGQAQVFDAAGFTAWVSGAAQALPPSFNGVTQDTRRLTPGCLYVALRGERFDGHAFVRQALEGGAAAALVDTAWQAPPEAAGWPLLRVVDTRRALADAARAWRKESGALVVGLTGSSGKTTTKEMAAALFSGGGKVCATQGNLNNEIGLPLSLLTMPRHTDFGVFEIGTSHPGEIGRLTEMLLPRAGVVTSIGSAHIEYFGSVEAIAREKGALLAGLPRDGFAVLCRETACFEMLAEMSRAPVVTTSLKTRDAAYYGERVEPHGGTLRVCERDTGEETELRSGLPGEHNASNLLLAFAAVRQAGVAARAAAEGLLSLALPRMRWDVSARGGVTVVNDAYNANPQSMTAVLRTFMKLPCAGRRFVVLGDMLELGAHTEALHREVGRCVAELAPDGLVAVGPNAQRYLAEAAVREGFPASRVCGFADSETAVVCRELFKPGDCVLLKASRGIRLERILDGWQV